MNKRANIQDLILEILEERAQTKKEIRKKLAELKGSSISQPSLNEHLLLLLHANKINLKDIDWKIHDYLREKKRKSSNSKYSRETTKGQTFYQESFIFELTEKLEDDIRIRSLINDLIEGDYKKQLKAEDKLLFSFQNKIEKIATKRVGKWETYSKKLRITNMPDKVIMWLVGEERLQNKLKSVEMVVTSGEYEDGELEQVQMNNYILPRLRKDFSHKKFRFLEGEKIEDYNLIEDPVKKNIFIRMCLINDPRVNKRDLAKMDVEVGINEYLSDERLEKANYEPFTNDEFLERKLGFSKPKVQNIKEIEKLFNNIIKFIRFTKEDQAIYIEKLSYALSDDEDAEKYLTEIIKEATDGKENL